jgi:GNAT superfamily N-acetyltransferase
MRVPRVAGPDDEELVARVAARGFHDDPVMGWLFPDPAERPRLLELAFRGLAQRHFAGPGLIHVLDEACAAFWRPPLEPSGDATGPHQPDASPEESAAPPPAPLGFRPDVLERIGRLDAAMAAAHPEEPHWYLGVLSTLPEQQNRGLGTRALAPVLDRCDTEGLPAYLESSNPRNLPFYWRLSFESTGEIRLPDGPVLYQMWRRPRAG